MVTTAAIGSLATVAGRSYIAITSAKRYVFRARTASNLATLHPRLRPLAERHLRLLKDRGINVEMLSATRTYAEQDRLYAQGRTLPGNIVTNARGGYSNHNFSVAYDIGIFEDENARRYVSNGNDQRYRLAGELGVQVGLDWGGNWTRFRDQPHFEYPHGLTMAELRRRVGANEPIVPDDVYDDRWWVLLP